MEQHGTGAPMHAEEGRRCPRDCNVPGVRGLCLQSWGHRCDAGGGGLPYSPVLPPLVARTRPSRTFSLPLTFDV